MGLPPQSFTITTVCAGLEHAGMCYHFPLKYKPTRDYQFMIKNNTSEQRKNRTFHRFYKGILMLQRNVFTPHVISFYICSLQFNIFSGVTANRQEGSQEEKSGPSLPVCPTLLLILHCLHQFGCCLGGI